MMTSEFTPSLPRPSSRWAALLVPALGVCFALLFGAQAFSQAYFLNQHPQLKIVAIGAFTRWLLYAGFAPAVGWLVFRLPLERGHFGRRFPIYAGAGVVFAVSHCVITGLIYRAFHVYPRQDSLGEAITRLLLNFFGVHFVVFWTISGVYHAIRYHEESQRRALIALDLRTRLVRAHLDHLRAQLNPHFLFNTLNAMSTLALTGEREQVVRMLSRLSELLRVTLDRTLPQEITLSQEMEILEGYLDIQRTRFGARLEVIREIDDGARDALVPSMMLQPLIENALEHGIESRTGPGRVTLAIRRDQAKLRIRVEDSGPGFSAPASSQENGIGLSNTRARLGQLYGDVQELQYGNIPDGGAFVQVVLPYHTTPVTEESE